MSRVYIGAVNLLTVPVFLLWLGPEAFGLIGLSATMQMLCYIMDAGFSSTVTRELGRGSGVAALRHQAILSCRGIEKFYWIASPAVLVVAFLIGLVFVLKWSDGGQLAQNDLIVAISLMSVAIGFQWITGFYAAALYGANCHASVAMLQAIFWTARTLGALCVLWVFGAAPLTYFLWQALVAMLGAICFRLELHRKLPLWHSLPDAYTMLGSLRTFGSLVLAASGVSVALLVFNQVDKIIVGMRFSLETFGYYMLAWQIAGALYLIYNPIYNAYLPAIAAAVAAGEQQVIWRQARDGALIMAALVIPLAAIIAVFSREILFLWTGDLVTAGRADLLLSLTFLGAACHALFVVPYSVQMAFGRTSITLGTALVLVMLMILVMLIVGLYTADAAAMVAVWAMFSLIFLLVTMARTTRSLLQKPALPWIWATLVLPVVSSFFVSIIFHGFVDVRGSRLAMGMWVLCIYVISVAVLLVVSQEIRKSVFGAVREWLSLRAIGVM